MSNYQKSQKSFYLKNIKYKYENIVYLLLAYEMNFLKIKFVSVIYLVIKGSNFLF